MTTPLKEAAQLLGRKGGQATKGISTPAKTAAARENGKKGGRPRIMHMATVTGMHGGWTTLCGRVVGVASVVDLSQPVSCLKCLEAGPSQAPVETPPDAIDPDGWY